MFHFTLEPDQMQRAWAVYRLFDAAGTLQFVGHCRLSQIASTPDARANALFAAIFPPGRPMTVEVINIGHKKHHAQNFLWDYIKKHGRPFLLQHGTPIGLKGRALVCDQTGERFNTIVEAARAHGISTSALSNHLARKTGYASVKGKTYSSSNAAVPLHRPITPTTVAVPSHSHTKDKP